MLAIGQDIERALTEVAPIDALRELAIELNNRGVEKGEILREFYAYSKRSDDLGRNAEANYLEDVLDMMTGYYVGRNLDLK
jgi:hypothetical protein